jgi:chromatin modification-related protein EAF6
MELQIYNLETSYLTETASHSGGNIIQGFEGYLKNQSVGRRKYEVSETDRMFSNSSLTYQKVNLSFRSVK